MVSKQSVQKQLKKLGFNPNGWGAGEIRELHNILLPDEEIRTNADAVQAVHLEGHIKQGQQGISIGTD